MIRKLGGKVAVDNLADGGARVQLAIPLATLAYEPRKGEDTAGA